LRNDGSDDPVVSLFTNDVGLRNAENWLLQLHYAALRQKRGPRKGGLPSGDNKAAEELFDLFDHYGIFVVRRGELENWLPSIGAVGKKTDWTVSALEKMGSDPLATGYVRPTSGDVWDFVRKIVKWIGDPARKGTE
jgi:hypothetical protein